MTVTVSHDTLRGFVIECYQAMDVRKDASHLLADSLVQADLWGHQSHGVMRTFWYAARIQSGATNIDALPELDRGAGALRTMDGQGGIGQVIAKTAIEHAIQMSKSHGIGAVAVRNSGHFGTAMYFTKMAADMGCIGFLCTNASPAMAPWGGVEKRVGTNPWSWAAPAGKHPTMMLDISNTAVARGKLYLAKQRDETIPSGWAMDAKGNPTNDPVQGIAGTILPMAGHKGFAISVIMDMLSGILSGSGFGASITGPYVPDGKSGVGHLALAIDIETARGLEAFTADMEALIAELKSTPRHPETEEILYPGEAEAMRDVENRKEGIALPDDTAHELKNSAATLGVTAPF